MPQNALKILGEYADGFRDLVNAKVWPSDRSPAEALRLNSEDDWSFICVAMDVVGDATLALENFLRFSLDGPTKFDDQGEKYLRLYGVLSAAYVQQEAVLKLYALMNCPSPKKVWEVFDALEVRTLRHQVASHSVDYRVPRSNDVSTFVPVRIGLGGFSCMVTEGRGDDTRTVELDKEILAHCRAVTDVLDSIYEKSVKTFFQGNKSKIDEFAAKLAELRDIRAGTLIIRGATGTGPRYRVVLR